MLLKHLVVNTVAHSIHVRYIYLHENHKTSTIHVGTVNIPFVPWMRHGYLDKRKKTLNDSNLQAIQGGILMHQLRGWDPVDVQFLPALVLHPFGRDVRAIFICSNGLLAGQVESKWIHLPLLIGGRTKEQHV